MNSEIHVGLMKAVGYGVAFRQHDAAWERDENLTSEILPRHLVNAVVTSFTLQLCALFENGLDEYLAARYPDVKLFKSLGPRIEYLKSRQEFQHVADVEELVGLRNRLAHQTDRFATWDDWDKTYRTVKRELGHLGIVPASVP